MRQAIRERNPHRFVRKVWPWIAVVIAAMAISYWNKTISEEASRTADQVRVLVAKNAELAKGNRQLVIGLENSIIGACQKNGNALRSVIREEIQEGITSPHDPRLRELLPEASPQRVEEIVREGNAEKRARLKKAHPVDCRRAYRQYRP